MPLQSKELLVCLVPCPFAVRRPTTKRDSTSRSSTACTELNGDYSPVRSDGGRLCSKACLAISYTACRFKTQTEATHKPVGNKVGKWSASDRQVVGKWLASGWQVVGGRRGYASFLARKVVTRHCKDVLKPEQLHRASLPGAPH